MPTLEKARRDLDPAYDPERDDDARPGAERANRPRSLDHFVGQGDIRRQLRIFLDAARERGEAVDHVLFSGPPGLGKTTLAGVIAAEMGHEFKETTAPAITRPGDLAAILVSIEPDTVLFIDEIHRLATAVAEMLYKAMEDFRVDLLIGEGPNARSTTLEVPPFTLVGATTKPGGLPGPLRDRFGIQLRLDYYAPAELSQVVARDLRAMGVEADPDALEKIAGRSRGTPRVAKRLLRRVRDVMQSKRLQRVDADLAEQALALLGVDAHGLDALDRRYLETLAEHYRGGPTGVETLSAALNEDRETLETSVEPYLMSRGLLQRTPRGRMLTEAGFRIVGRTPPGQEDAAAKGRLL